jgi:hypothetical protein
MTAGHERNSPSTGNQLRPSQVKVPPVTLSIDDEVID